MSRWSSPVLPDRDTGSSFVLNATWFPASLMSAHITRVTDPHLIPTAAEKSYFCCKTWCVQWFWQMIHCGASSFSFLWRRPQLTICARLGDLKISWALFSLQMEKGPQCVRRACEAPAGVYHLLNLVLSSLNCSHSSELLSLNTHTQLESFHTPTLHTTHCTLHTGRYILYTARYTFQATLCTLHTVHCTLHTVQYTL